MLANILTCVGTGSIGVGVGLVINTIRAKSNAKRKSSEMENLTSPSQKRQSVQNKNEKNNIDKNKDLFLVYGIKSYLATIDKYISGHKEEVYASDSLKKYLRRILYIIDQSQQDHMKGKYWNPGGAVSVNAKKVKLWLRTLDHIFRDRLGNLPDDLVTSMQYIIDYVKAEQYNKLLD
jgi:hypothetical protein